MEMEKHLNIPEWKTLRLHPLGWRLLEQFIFPAGLIATGFFTLDAYLGWIIPTFITGLIAIAASARKGRTDSNRYGYAAMLFLLLCFLVPVKTFLFFSLAFSLFYWVERNYARLPFPAMAALVLASPVFEYGASAFSFPLRLQLTDWVTGIFSLFGEGVSSRGNVIVHEGFEFSVDPACMGLHMCSLSILLGILFIGLLQMKSKKIVPLLPLTGYIGFLFLCNLAANLLRIFLLVQFAIAPGTLMHEVIGLLCLLFYVCLPAVFTAKWILARWGKAKVCNPVLSTRNFPVILYILFAGIVALAIKVQKADTFQPFAGRENSEVKGFTNTLFAPGILKLENEKTLVYVKFIRGFYDTEHNPTICWKGSGFEFREIKNENFNGHEVFTSLLQKGDQKLFTAWWYENGQSQTTSQWTWRKDLLSGSKPYAVVNVTAGNKKDLASAILQLKKESLLQPVFQ
jgi:exosortase N